MRFMRLMIPKGYETAPADALPDPKIVAAMMKYNEALQKAGVLLALERSPTTRKWARAFPSREANPRSATVPSPKPKKFSAATG